MICRDFFFNNKEALIKFDNVDEIRGGLFSGYPTRPIYIHDSENNITIGFYSHVGNFQKLLTIILQNIPQYLYNDLMDKLKNSKRGKKE